MECGCRLAGVKGAKRRLPAGPASAACAGPWVLLARLGRGGLAGGSGGRGGAFAGVAEGEACRAATVWDAPAETRGDADADAVAAEVGAGVYVHGDVAVANDQVRGVEHEQLVLGHRAVAHDRQAE